jgi:Domain of unknown function (DUF4136)
MTALHPQPILSVSTSCFRPFYKAFNALAQWNTAQAAIKLIALLLLIQLTGCASVRLIDNDVNTFSKLTAVPAGSTYRFERLPSQQTDTQRQDQLEAIAQASLDKTGLRRVGDAPGSPAARYSVQMGVVILNNTYAYWDDSGPELTGLAGLSGLSGYVSVSTGPYFYGSPYWYGHRRRHGYIHGYFGPYPYLPPPSYVYEVSLVMREAANSQVVFETRAKHQGPWSDSVAILPAMFDAALQGFPTPPTGPRRVNVEIPR